MLLQRKGRKQKHLACNFPHSATNFQHNHNESTVAHKCHNTIQIRKHISMSTTNFQTDNTTRYLLKTHFNIHNTFPNSQHNSLVCENTSQYAQQMHFQTWKQY